MLFYIVSCNIYLFIYYLLVLFLHPEALVGTVAWCLVGCNIFTPLSQSTQGCREYGITLIKDVRFPIIGSRILLFVKVYIRSYVKVCIIKIEFHY